MFFAILTLISALFISCVAAYYSIVGLTTLFSGAVMAVAIMAIALEIGKVVTATWLHRNWSVAPFLLKSYLTVAVVVLMFITSMGIFGFLSKAHLQQTGSLNVVTTKIEKIEFDLTQESGKITAEQKKIESAQKVLDQLDKSTEIYFQKEYVTRGLREREAQKEEREELQQTIDNANTKISSINDNISKLNEEKFELTQEVKDFEVEVGPVKYIADMIYGEEEAKDLLDETIRFVIIIFIFVFDPLAILLIIAANFSLEQNKKKKEVHFKSDKEDIESTQKKFFDALKVPEKEKPVLNKLSGPQKRNLPFKKKKEVEETILSIPAIEALKRQEPEKVEEIVKEVEKIVYKPSKPSQEEIDRISQDILQKLSESPQVPYNLESGNIGNSIKTIIANSIKKEYND